VIKVSVRIRDAFPEAIKLCPVIWRLRSSPEDFDTRVCVTAQHRHMLDQVSRTPSTCAPITDLDLIAAGPDSVPVDPRRILAALEPVLREERPDLVLVQGDTTTTLCGALAAFYARISGRTRRSGPPPPAIWPQPFPEGDEPGTYRTAGRNPFCRHPRRRLPP